MGVNTIEQLEAYPQLFGHYLLNPHKLEGLMTHMNVRELSSFT